MKFKFSLHTLLKAKEIREKETQKLLVDIINEIQELKNREESFMRELAECRQDFTEMCNNRTASVADLTLYQNYFKNIEEKLSDLRKMIEDASLREIKMREQLLGITKEKKSLENLKAKEYDKYINDINYKEAKELDEVSVRIFNQNKTTG